MRHESGMLCDDLRDGLPIRVGRPFRVADGVQKEWKMTLEEWKELEICRDPGTGKRISRERYRELLTQKNDTNERRDEG